ERTKLPDLNVAPVDLTPPAAEASDTASPSDRLAALTNDARSRLNEAFESAEAQAREQTVGNTGRPAVSRTLAVAAGAAVGAGLSSSRSADSPADGPIDGAVEPTLDAPADGLADTTISVDGSTPETVDATLAAVEQPVPPPAASDFSAEPVEIPGSGASKGWLVWLLVAVIAGGAGAYGYFNRDTVVPYIQALTEKARELDEPTEAEPPKIEDRVGEDGAVASDEAETEAPPDTAESTEDVAPDESETVEADAAATDGPPAEQAETGPSEEELLEAQRRAAELQAIAEAQTPLGLDMQPLAPALTGEQAFLYEEAVGDGGGDLAHNAAIVWEKADEPGIQGADPTVLRGIARVPSRNMLVTVTMRKNTDPTLPASHTFEVQFDLPADAPFGTVSEIGGFLAKNTEPERGTPMVGAAARVTEGFFILGLSDQAEDLATNLDLLKNREWLDVPIIYANGKRAIVTLSKGETGGAALTEVLTAWGEAD
ncbi:MAG: hypothetical protein AAF638_13390, partial [Pseudomonadota bacterium]